MAAVELLLSHFGAMAPQAVLDLGCGAGSFVRSLCAEGFDAWGCDIADSNASDFPGRGASVDRLRPIETNPYRLPFEDSSFDFVISCQVLEHVTDHAATFREIHRVLKPGGISLHTFPSRYVLIEPHVCVPLASVIRNRYWLHLWALLGIRNSYQAGQPAYEVASQNYSYLNSYTNYLAPREILRHARSFSEAIFREDVFFLPGPAERRKRSLKKRLFLALGGDRIRLAIFATFNMRALFLKK